MSTDEQISQLFTLFQQTWPNLSTALEGHQFPTESNPAPLLSAIASTTDTPEKAMFCSLLSCFDAKVASLKAQAAVKDDKISSYNNDFCQARKQFGELNGTLDLARKEIINLNQVVSVKCQQLETQIFQR